MNRAISSPGPGGIPRVLAFRIPKSKIPPGPDCDIDVFHAFLGKCLNFQKLQSSSLLNCFAFNSKTSIFINNVLVVPSHKNHKVSSVNFLHSLLKAILRLFNCSDVQVIAFEDSIESQREVAATREVEVTKMKESMSALQVKFHELERKNRELEAEAHKLDMQLR